MVTLEPGLNPAPVIFTDVPTGPEAGSRIIKGFSKAVTVNVFEAELKKRKMLFLLLIIFWLFVNYRSHYV